MTTNPAQESQKPTRTALDQLTGAIRDLDEQTGLLQNQLEYILLPDSPSPDCADKEEKEVKEIPASSFTNALHDLTVDTNNTITRIKNILARLEI